jgi:hypothetical protein
MKLTTSDEISGLKCTHNDSLIPNNFIRTNGPKNVKKPLRPLFIPYVKGIPEKFECIGNCNISTVHPSEFADENQSRGKHEDVTLLLEYTLRLWQKLRW